MAEEVNDSLNHFINKINQNISDDLKLANSVQNIINQDPQFSGVFNITSSNQIEYSGTKLLEYFNAKPAQDAPEGAEPRNDKTVFDKIQDLEKLLNNLVKEVNSNDSITKKEREIHKQIQSNKKV